MITLTDKAREKVEEISNSEGTGYYSLRILMRPGGCAGLSSDMYLDDRVGELDDTIDFEGVQVIIDPFSRDILGDFTLEYIDEVMTQGFKFIVDGETRTSCGCGNSTGIV
jgi:iron-sulfur cluster assembly accessory protein